jgi:peroxiredoxin
LARFESRRPELEKKGAKICAICVDSVEKSKAVVQKKSLGFPILSDPTGETIRAWGVWHESHRIALPAVFVVGRDGKIAWRRVSESVDDRPPEDDVLEAVAKTPS